MNEFLKRLAELLELIGEFEEHIEAGDINDLSDELRQQLEAYQAIKEDLERVHQDQQLEEFVTRKPYTQDEVKGHVKQLLSFANDRDGKKKIKETYKALKKAIKAADLDWETEASDELIFEYFPRLKPIIPITPLKPIGIKNIPVPEIEIEIQPLRKPDPILLDDEIKLGNELLHKFPDGLKVIFYEIDDEFNLAIFRDGSNRWAREQGAIGFTGAKPTVSSITFKKAMPERINAKSKGIGGTLTSLGAFVKKCMIKAHQYNNQIYYPSELPNPAYAMSDDAYLFKTVALSSHGWVGGVSLDVEGKELAKYNNNIKSFVTSCSPYLADDVNIIFYSCTSASGDEEDNDWEGSQPDVNDGGSDSLIAEVLKELVALGHDEAEAWGHTSVDGYFHNKNLRFFKVADSYNGVIEGKNYMLYCYDKLIDDEIAVIEELIKAKSIEKYNAADKTVLRDLILTEIKPDLIECYNAAFENRGIQITDKNSGKTVRRKLSEIAPLAPEKVKDIVVAYRKRWKKKYYPKLVASQVFRKL